MKHLSNPEAILLEFGIGAAGNEHLPATDDERAVAKYLAECARLRHAYEEHFKHAHGYGDDIDACFFPKDVGEQAMKS